MFLKTVVLGLFVVGVFGQQFSFEQFNADRMKDVLREQCKKVNAEDKTDEVAAAGQTFANCVKELVNVEQLKDEIEKAKPNGALDEVFKKYCAKTPQLKTCIHTLFDGVKPCLDDTTKEVIESSKNGTDQLIDFVCYKDGDRIALFIAEQGPECFTTKMNAIRDCYNKVKDAEPKVGPNTTLTIAQRCQKYDDISACTVTALEGCNTPTPANMAESLFKYVRKSSPCNTALPKD